MLTAELVAYEAIHYTSMKVIHVPNKGPLRSILVTSPAKSTTFYSLHEIHGKRKNSV
jgi:hypothetical protein